MTAEEIIAQILEIEGELLRLGVRREFVRNKKLSEDDLHEYLESKREQLATRKKWLGVKEIGSSDSDLKEEV